MEFIAMLLLAPFIWSSTHAAPPPTQSWQEGETALVSPPSISSPRTDSSEGRFRIYPPSDTRLTMVVLEHAVPGGRGPASNGTSKMIEVIITAP